LFLKKLEFLCEQYRRPLDVIEINILLAIAYWKKVRGAQNDAFEPLEKAIVSAQEYGFTQIFANEGAELSNMLHKLQKRVIQKDYPGNISTAQARTLYIMTLARAKQSPGLTGGRTPENMKFTEKQKTVMQYLCEGLTQKEIGGKMGLKHSAIKSHMILIYKKLDVTNAVEAMLKIKDLGLLEK
jgi:LuxR family maltose regulon positive regulatory protein